MPRPNKKATQAKKQRSTASGRNNFISTPKDIDSGSNYNSESSSDEASDGSSSDESMDATKKLFSRKLPSHLRHQVVCHLSFETIIRLLTWLPDRLWASVRDLWFTERTPKGLITVARNTGKKLHKEVPILGPSSRLNPHNWCQSRKCMQR